ncbi:MAG TPA: T9SS type A sorting domain-containing protein, partial [Bacteroidia bacterium]|nr:T9SS type A sorting domain-containing protein [Bacteroidia bacterium]
NTCKVYPNPATSSIKIEASNINGTAALLNIADITGRLVFQKNIDNGTNTINTTVDVSSLQTGIYLVTLKEGSKQFTTKLVKQ